jgi:hypothetical protein
MNLVSGAKRMQVYVLAGVVTGIGVLNEVSVIAARPIVAI